MSRCQRANGELNLKSCDAVSFLVEFGVDWWALGVLSFEMLVGRSPFDIVGQTDNPDQNTEDYLFQGRHSIFYTVISNSDNFRVKNVFCCIGPCLLDLNQCSPEEF